MTKQDLKDYLIEEAEFKPEWVNNATPYQLVDAYLKYNGIIGYTDDIFAAVGAALDIENLQKNILETFTPFLEN